MNLRSNDTPIRGDKVRVKDIDGPIMIVLEESEHGDYEVTWFDKTHVLHTAKFGLDLLEKIKAPAMDSAKIQIQYIRTSSIEALKAVVQIPAFQNALANNRKIEAIKIVREYTGLGLKEAKDFVESPEIAYRKW
jgi:ribosomal protein L7/L12